MASNPSLSEILLQNPLEQNKPDSAPKPLPLDDLILNLTSKALKNLQIEDCVLNDHTEESNCVSFSPDGSRIVAGLNSNIKVWDSEKKKLLYTLPDQKNEVISSVISAVLSTDNKLLASGEKDGIVKIWRVEPEPRIVLSSYENLEEVKMVRFKPDASFIAIASSSNEKSIKIRGVLNQEEFDLKIEKEVLCLEFSPDGEFLASGGYDNQVKLWDFNAQKVKTTFNGHSKSVISIAFSYDSCFIVSGSWDKSIIVWNIKEESIEFTLFGHIKAVVSVAFSSDGKMIASGSEDTTVKIWDFYKRQEKITLHGHSKEVNSVSFSPVKQSLVSSAADQTVRYWNIKGKYKPKSIINYKNIITSACFAPDSKIIVTGCKDGHIRGWNIEESTQTFDFHINYDKKKENSDEENSDEEYSDEEYSKVAEIEIYSLIFDNDGKSFAHGTDDNRVLIWDYQTKKKIFETNSPNPIISVSFSVNRRFLATGSDSGKLRVWDLLDKKIIHRFDDDESNKIPSTCFSEDNQFFAYSIKNQINLCTPSDFEPFKVLQAHQQLILTLRFSSDSKQLAAGLEDGQLQIIQMKKPFESLILNVTLSPVTSLTFSSNDLFIITGHEDSSLIFWNMKEKREELIIFTGSSKISSIICSKNGKYFAAGSFDNSLKIWTFEENLKLTNLQENNDPDDAVHSISYSKNGKMIAAGFENKKIKVFYLETGKNIELGSHLDSVNCVRFSNDGKILATGSSDKQVKIWDMEKLKEINVFKRAHELKITDLLILSKISVILTCSRELAIKVWELKKGIGENNGKNLISGKQAVEDDVKAWKVLNGHAASVMCLDASPDERFFVSGSGDCSLKVWNVESWIVEFSFSGHLQAVCSVKYSPNGMFLASGSEDRSIKIWNIDHKCEEFSLNNNSKAVLSISYSPDGKHFASSSGNTLKIWNLEEKLEKFTEKITSGQILTISFSPSGREIAAGCNDGSLKVLNILKPEEKWEKSLKSLQNQPFSFTKDGNFAVSGSEDGEVNFWMIEEESNSIESQNFHNWRELKILNYRKIDVHSGRVNSIDYCFNGEFIACASDDGRLVILNANEKKVEGEIEKDSGPVLSCKFSNDGFLLAAGFLDKPMKIWNMQERVEDSSILFEKIGVCLIRFSSNDQLLASASLDSCLEVWDLQKKLKVFTASDYLLGHPFALSPDEWYISYPVSKSNYKIISITENTLFKEFTTKFEISDIFYSKYSEYLLISTSWGFDIFNIFGGFFLESFTILSYGNLTLSLEILSKKTDFLLTKPLNLNNQTKELLFYQNKYKTKTELQKTCIDPNAFNDFSRRRFPKHDLFYQGALNFISKENISKLSYFYFNFIMTEYFQTVLHLQTFQGHEKSIENILHPGKLDLIPKDKFGKSPIFYAIKKKHFRCAQIFLKYLININKKSENLYLQLTRIQNEFGLIIQSSFKELPALLSKFIFETDAKMVFESRETPQLLIFDEEVNPLYLLDEKKEGIMDQGEKKEQDDKQMPALVKYFTTPLPIQIYSTENIEILTALQRCSNVKIFENLLIQQFIDYNWEEVKVWIQGYSVLSVLNLIIFSLSVAYGRTVLWIYIPFMVVFSLLLMWEVLQIINSPSLTEYFQDPMNWVDLSTIALVIYWSLAGFFSFDSIYEEFLLAFLIALRGITSFRIFDGTRSYFRLIIQSLNGMKHFVLVFLYSTFVFTVLLYILNQNNEKYFFIIFESVWNLNFTGAYQEGYTVDEVIIYIVAIIATILNVVLMLNLLISILSDNYDGFMIDRQVHDFKEKIDSALEIQTTLFWNKNHNKRKFLYIICTTFKEGEDNQNNDWPGKIKYLEQCQIRKITEVEEKVNDLNLKVGGVDEKVAGVEEKICALDFKINEKVFALENGISDKVAEIERKIDSQVKEMRGDIREILEILKNKEDYSDR